MRCPGHPHLERRVEVFGPVALPRPPFVGRTYDRRISKSLIPSDETENHYLVLTVPGTLFRQTERREREEITKNHSARSELPDSREKEPR